MSDFEVSSQFAHQLQDGEYHDDLLDLDAFDIDQIDTDLADGQILENSAALVNEEDGGLTEEPQVDEELQRLLSGIETAPPFDGDQLFEGVEPIRSPQNEAPANETLGGNEVLPDSDYQLRDEEPALGVEYHPDLSGCSRQNVQQTISSHGQQEPSPPRKDPRCQPQISQFSEAHEESTSPQNVTSASVLPNASQPQADATSGGNQPQFDDFEFDVFGSKEWNEFAKDPANADLVDFLDIDVQDKPQTFRDEQERHADHQGLANNNVSQVENEQIAHDIVDTTHAVVDEDGLVEDFQEPNGENQIVFETYEEDDQLINAETPQKGWGQIGKRNGQEVWFNPETSKWQPSASHHSMRATLIARAQAEYPNDTYLHPDPTDGLPHGETAFFKPHQNRGPDREQCADELFVWRQYKSKKDEDGKPLRRGKPKYTIRDHPGFMYEGNKILLDPHNNPVVNHKHIPLTLSVYTDGGKLQEMALRPGCRQLDLWARMPRWEKRTGKNGRSEMVSLRDKNTRINMPMTRFREKKGTIAGGDREGTDTIMAGLASFYRHNGFDPVASGNSVKAFPRDLLPWEVKEVRLGNTARFGVRAGNRALDEDKRGDNYQKTLQAIENGKKKQAAKDEGSTKKRRLEDEAADSHSSTTGARKRHRTNQEADFAIAAWDNQQETQQGAPSFRGGHDLSGNQPMSNRQQGGPSQAPPSSQFNSYGSSYQRSAPQERIPRVQSSSYPSQSAPYLGTSSTPGLNGTLQAAYSGATMQASRSHYEKRPVQTSMNSNIANNNYNSGAQKSFEGANAAPAQVVNTLGPGGRRVQQAPTQVLGKRRQQVADELEENESWIGGTQQQPVPAAPSHGSNPMYKRRRIDETPSVESQQQQQQQRRRQVERAPRPQYYGAVGAPLPLIPPDEFNFEIPGPSSGFITGAGGRFKPPEELFRELGNAFGDMEPTPTTNEGRIYGTVHTPTQQSEYTQRVPRGYEPQQVLGRRRREEPMGQWDESLYVPQQYPGQRTRTEYPGGQGQYSQLPGPKRRRMHGPEG